MGTRLQLHDILVKLMTEVDPKYATEHVYFQPPSNIRMKYPCIVYQRNSGNISHADDIPYTVNRRYQITVIDKNPDSVILDKVEQISGISFDRHYVSDNLNHDSYNLYF